MNFVTREQVEKGYTEMVNSKGKGDICLYWHRRQKAFCSLDYEELFVEVERWNVMAQFVMDEYNNLEVVGPDGKKWFACVLQFEENKCCEDENCCRRNNTGPMDPMASLLFGVMVPGFTYVFETAEMRDWVAEAVNQRKPLLSPVCCLCRSACETKYGNNPYPLAPDTARCCDQCNLEKVFPARVNERIKKMEEQKKVVNEHMTTIGDLDRMYCENNCFVVDPSFQSLVENAAMLEVKERFLKIKDTIKALGVHTKIEIETLADEVSVLQDDLVNAHLDGVVFVRKEEFAKESDKIGAERDKKNKEIVSRYYESVFPLYDERQLLYTQYKLLESRETEDLAAALISASANTTDESDHSSNSSNSKRAKKLGAKQAQTRNANRAKLAAIEERKAFELKEAECAKYRAEQERKAKQAKLLKKQKKEREKAGV